MCIRDRFGTAYGGGSRGVNSSSDGDELRRGSLAGPVRRPAADGSLRHRPGSLSPGNASGSHTVGSVDLRCSRCDWGLSALFNPSQVRLVGQIVARNMLVRANSHLSVSREGAEIGGYLVGGALVASLGYFTTFTIDAATYGISALLLLGLP